MQDDPQADLAGRYDRGAPTYRDRWAPILRIAGLRLLRELGGTSVQRIVDVGTGVGALLPDLQQTFSGACILGIDRSQGMLALAPAGSARAVMDAAHLGLAPASVDLVLLVFVLFHLERPLDGLREARRVLRHGGRVGCVTWAGELESPATRIWTECLDAHGAAPADPSTEIRHDAVNTPARMEGLLRTAAFTSVRCWADELASPIPLDDLIHMRTQLGREKPRFDSLSPHVQEACVADARRRMEKLAREDFVARGMVVYATAGV